MERDPGLERLDVLAAASLVVQPGDLLHRLVAERECELLSGVRPVEARADEGAVVRVDDDAGRVPELHAGDVVGELLPEDPVELRHPLGPDRRLQVDGPEDQAGPLGDVSGDGGCLRLRPALDVRPDQPEDDDPGQAQHDRAVDGEP